ncbi:MAG: fatty acid kinase, partial [Nocardioidaceae bacterium]|nr:fatty acid kinase [Nocardioidaceae bacterium]
MPEAGFAVPLLLRFATLAVEGLAAAREEIDALNVYPVPDGDTGTNLFLTFEAASAALRDALGGGSIEDDVDTDVDTGVDTGVDTDDASDRDPDARLADALAAYSRGLLLGARGNSGVIMSELVGALLRHLAEAQLRADP